MTVDVLTLTPALHQYMLSNSLRESDTLKAIREYTLSLPQSGMLLAPEQAQFLAFLNKLLGSKKSLEIGVFTGYSTLAIAEALPADGQVIACDINKEWTKKAAEFWNASAHGGKIDLRIAPAVETLAALIDQGETGSFDYAFIDADKSNYATYFEQCLQLLRAGGLIAFDNVLWEGQVLDESIQDKDTNALREIVKIVHHDERVDVTLVPIGDGLLLARKR